MNNANTTISTELDIDQLNALDAVNDHLVEVPAITPPAKLKAKRSRIKGAWALPFTSSSRKKSNTPFWIVPAAGGYVGGYEAGQAMARSYLKFLRDSHFDGCGSLLSSITSSMAMRIEQEKNNSHEYESLHGQKIGFFNELDKWLSFAAKNAGKQLDGLTNKDFIKEANIGLTKEAWEI